MFKTMEQLNYGTDKMKIFASVKIKKGVGGTISTYQYWDKGTQNVLLGKKSKAQNGGLRTTSWIRLVRIINAFAYICTGKF